MQDRSEQHLYKTVSLSALASRKKRCSWIDGILNAEASTGSI